MNQNMVSIRIDSRCASVSSQTNVELGMWQCRPYRRGGYNDVPHADLNTLWRAPRIGSKIWLCLVVHLGFLPRDARWRGQRQRQDEVFSLAIFMLARLETMEEEVLDYK